MSIINLLSTGPGVFVYHFLVLLTLEAVAGIAFIEWRQSSNSSHRRTLWTLVGLLGMRALLVIGESISPASMAPILNGIELASTTLLGWCFLSPHLDNRAGRIYLLTGLSLTILCTISFLPSWYKVLAQLPNMLYLTFWQQTFWYAINGLLMLVAVFMLVRTSSAHRPRALILGFAALSLGFTAVFLGTLILILSQSNLFAYTLIGAGRIINAVSYPLFAVTVHRMSTMALDKEPRAAGEDSFQRRELRLLVETSRAINDSLDLNVLLQNLAETTATGLGVDRCAIFLTNAAQGGIVDLTTQYAAHTPGASNHYAPFPLSEQPALLHALERRKPLVINAEIDDQLLPPLYDLLGSQATGPTLVQPLLHHRRILGALVLGNDHSQRAFGLDDERLCQSIAAHFSGAIEKARLYRAMEKKVKPMA